MDFLPSGGFAVSIQLVSPASGEAKLKRARVAFQVSIQLVSPASGESLPTRDASLLSTF